MTTEELQVTSRTVVTNVRGKRLHVAIIMDGNGRWATQRGLPRIAGHRAGAQAVRRTVECAARRGVGTLTLFAFSSDNWQRPIEETGALMRLLRAYLMREAATCRKNGIRVSVIGRRDRIAPDLRALIVETEAATRGNSNLHLRLAIDYSARDAIMRAAETWAKARRQGEADNVLTRECFAELLGDSHHDNHHAPDVDLLIRTGGEQRLSDFLLWECAYAEFLFTPVMFPDFADTDLDAALTEFHRRERRFGSIPTTLTSNIFDNEKAGTHAGGAA